MIGMVQVVNPVFVHEKTVVVPQVPGPDITTVYYRVEATVTDYFGLKVRKDKEIYVLQNGCCSSGESMESIIKRNRLLYGHPVQIIRFEGPSCFYPYTTDELAVEESVLLRVPL